MRQLKAELSLDPGVPKVSQFQYGNTPSCEDIDFGTRYWGSNYPRSELLNMVYIPSSVCRLLKIKRAWDPDNVFHHCQSVGSTDQHCCPY